MEPKAIAPQLLVAHALAGHNTVGCYFEVGKSKATTALKVGYKFNRFGLPGAKQEIVI